MWRSYSHAKQIPEASRPDQNGWAIAVILFKKGKKLNGYVVLYLLCHQLAIEDCTEAAEDEEETKFAYLFATLVLKMEDTQNTIENGAKLADILLSKD